MTAEERAALLADLHTTAMGEERIRRNAAPDAGDDVPRVLHFVAYVQVSVNSDHDMISYHNTARAASPADARIKHAEPPAVSTPEVPSDHHINLNSREKVNPFC